MTLAFFPLFGLLPLTIAVAIDNAVKGTPKVICNTGSIRFMVDTEKPFLGRIFAKGMSKRPECARDFPDANATQAEFDLNLSNCGMMRQRKVDRAFSIKCFYSKTQLATVQHTVNISQIATETLAISQGRSAECKYDVRIGGPDGPMAEAAQVGDTLHHMWSCVGPSDLRILVKDCRVFDGDSEEFLIVDSRGCAVDPVIVPDLTYSPSAHTAQVQSHAFKFADTNFLGFQCTVQLCSEINGDDSCGNISPPACSVSGFDAGIVSQARAQVFSYRQRRLNDQTLPPVFGNEVDVSSPTMAILDTSSFQAGSKRRRLVLDDSDALPDGNVSFEEVEEATESVCLSHTTFTMFTVAVVLVFMVACTIVVVQCYQSIKHRKMNWWKAV